jgi:class 3 adenylate cyclase
MIRCPSCGEENQASKKFCGECGTPLAAPTHPSREVRKTVTILFADVTESTALGERLDPESLRTVMGRYFGAMKQVVERHGGTVEKFIGDAVMAVFGIPTLHEDDALRAVRAAAEMREALASLNTELLAQRGVTIATRTGVNTGEVVAGDPSAGQTLVTGDPVNTAARLEQAARAGEILLGEPTYRLVRDAVAVEHVMPVNAYRLLSVTAGAGAHARRLDAPLVGRDDELARLAQAFRQAVKDRSCSLFTLLGAAGVGKSRLVAEFLAALSTEALVLKGHCVPYGEGITYWPLAEVVRAAAGIEESDTAEDAQAKLRSLLEGERDADIMARRIASAIGLSVESAPSEEIFRAVRKLLQHLARQRPLVVLWEDIHWAEPTFLDLIEHIADLSRDAPLLVLCPARPELLDRRPGWGGGKLNATTVLLEPLAPEATERLLEGLPGGLALPPDLRRRILDAAEGNPLYIEEMLGMLLEEGSLAERDGEWRAVGNLATMRVPPSIQALLAARLDQLGPDERAIAEHASVVGRVFEESAVRELAPEPLRPRIARGLMALMRKELVRPERSEASAGDAFKFRHILIRDAAYEGLPKAERAELHERLAAWLERVAGDRAVEYAEVIAHHVEQAYRYRIELGETGDTVARLQQRAGDVLASAGRRASERGDTRAATSLLERAAAVLALGSRERIEVLLMLGDVLGRSGSLERAILLMDEAHELADANGDESLSWQARLSRAEFSWGNGTTDLASLVPLARRALEVFARLDDPRGEARAQTVLSFVRLQTRGKRRGPRGGSSRV